jgi:hypothetical protein
MCNCGPRRVVPLPSTLPTTVTPTKPMAYMPRPKPVFEYVGATALTVIGPGSGLRYRFDRPGATLAVDPRDRAALEAVPLLRTHSEPLRLVTP